MMNKPEMRPWMTTGYWSPVLATGLPNSGSESDQRDLIEERKRKRLESNRESARRSRMKKREYLDNLKAQQAQLCNENRKTTAELAVTTERYVKLEAENSVTRAQLTELNHRLISLNRIIGFAEPYYSAAGGFAVGKGHSAAGGFGMKTGHSASGGFGMETDPSGAAGRFGMKTGHSAAGGFGMETDPSAATGGFGMETGHSTAGGFGMETDPSAAAGGFGMKTGQTAAGGFGMETGHSTAGGFGMETDTSAAGGFGMETGHSAAGGFGMEIGQGGGVTGYGGGSGREVTDYGGGSGGGGGYYDGEMNPHNLGFYNQTPNMASASTGVGDVLNCW